MKSLIALIALALSTTLVSADVKPAPTPPKTKEVCKVKDGKKTCKTIKVRKKLDGKKIPTK